MTRRAGTLGVLALLCAAVLLCLLRAVGPAWHWSVLVASFAWAALPAFVVAALGLLLLLRGATRRGWVAAGLAVAAAGVALQAAWLVPAYVGPPGGDPGGHRGPTTTVLTANLRFGEADPDAVAGLLRESRPDVVVLTEVTPSLMAALEPRLETLPVPLPHRAGRPLPAAAGTAVLSRWPLSAETELRLANSGYAVEVAAPEPFTLSAVHVGYPLQEAERWRADLARVEAQVARVEGPHLVVGDLNATVDHAAFRDVLAAGVRSASEQAGSGWQPTWPAPRERAVLGVPVPLALLELDHVLVSPGLVATRTRAVVLPGTDHLALVAEVARH